MVFAEVVKRSTNVGNSKLAEKGVNFDVDSSAHGTSSVAFDGKPLKKIDDPINADTDSEVNEVFNETAGFMASTSSKINKNGSGVGNKSLYEKWK
ncbi:hypothetical protein Tco_1465219 [Tanacetum coccineum]